ncbi:polysaccharide pyruvyl transferase family protein [Erwinia sp. BNK-24-b]|uniref:polysaccharide pyruvyl transferase family protein n=1 Tax=Erwinia TaxID=551 RepID=UPI001FEF0EF0|nr:polysaccharide pyruvyl transferase family protein [Erwinia phyllosphaerae]MBV4365403.1 polysaccharide pyruvyl transferase family protein [Erwinia phyllosphaerae]
MIDLKNQLNAIVAEIKDKNDVIYLDYPFHHNVGDLLIYAGTLQFFRDNNIKVKLCRSEKDFDLAEIRKKLTPNTTILCHGGGNFGDIYFVHQNLREQVVKNFRQNKVIIMPQTAHFSDEKRLAESAAIFRQHPDVVIYSRDTRSFELFKRFTDKVYMMPDMAHQLYGSLKINNSKKDDTLYFLRVDCEASADQSAYGLPQETKTFDWVDLITEADQKKIHFLSRVAKVGKKLNSSLIKNYADKAWRDHTFEMANRNAHLFSGYKEVVTSRMHGHILSCLVDTNNMLIDNSYGKNSGYYAQWTQNIDHARLYSQS